MDHRRHLDAVPHPGHLDEVRHRLGVAHLDADPDPDDPCLGLEQTGCCLDERLGVECPCPGWKRMGYFPDVECLRHRQGLGLQEQPGLLRLALQEQPARQELQRQDLQRQEPGQRQQREQEPSERLVLQGRQALRRQG